MHGGHAETNPTGHTPGTDTLAATVRVIWDFQCLRQCCSIRQRGHAASGLMYEVYLVHGIALASLLSLEVLAPPQNADLQTSNPN